MSNAQTALSVDVVVIDDEEPIREGCRQALERRGYRTLVAEDGLQGIHMVEDTRPHLILLDQRMPKMDGIEILKKLPAIDPRIVPIIITGYGTVESAVASMKLGAFDFIAKPFNMKQLVDVVARGISQWNDKALLPSEEPVAGLKAAKSPSARNFNESDVLLEGLEVVARYRSLGIKEQSLPRKLADLEAEATHYANRIGQIREEEKVIEDLIADLKLVDRVIEKHDYKKNALIQVLLDVQGAKGWLPHHVLLWTGRRLGIPLTRIYAVASFYEAFSLVPQGAHTVQVCTGTACHVRSGDQLLSKVSSLLGVKPGQTDPSMQFTLKTVNCMGCCALAPVMKVDQAYYGNPSLKEIKTVFQDLCEKGESHA